MRSSSIIITYVLLLKVLLSALMVLVVCKIVFKSGVGIVSSVMVGLIVTACSESEVDLLLSTDSIDILDLKDVSVGESLGCPKLDLVCYAVDRRGKARSSRAISVPVGDFCCPVSCVRLCVELLDRLGVDFVKVGLAVRSSCDAYRLLRLAVEGASSAKIVASCFGDWKLIGAVRPFEVVDVARKLDVEHVLVDTRTKSGKCLLDFVGLDELQRLVEYAHSHALKVAVAGGLTLSSVRLIVESVPVDYVAVRSGVCVGGRGGRIDPVLLRRLISLVKSPELVEQH